MSFGLCCAKAEQVANHWQANWSRNPVKALQVLCVQQRKIVRDYSASHQDKSHGALLEPETSRPFNLKASADWGRDQRRQAP